MNLRSVTLTPLRTPAVLIGMLSFLATLAGATTNTPDQALYFRNGDSIKGSLLSIDLTNGVVWTKPGMIRPARFLSSNVTEIFLTSRPASDDTDIPYRTIVRFANGDEIVGNLLSITNRIVQLQTSYAGLLSIPREIIAGLTPQPKVDRVIFDGPRSDEDWTHGDMRTIRSLPIGRWHYHNASFVSGVLSSIARSFDLPFEIRMDFDLYWHNQFGLAIALHTDSLEPITLNVGSQKPDFVPFYSLALSHTQTELRLVPKTGLYRRLGIVALPMLSRTNHAAISIFASKKRKSVALMINSRVVKEWVDPQGWSAGGRGIRFVHQGYGNVRIANLRITKWNGNGFIPLSINANPQVDVALMNDASARGGQLIGYTNGIFHFQSGSAVLPINFTNTTEVNFALSSQKPVASPTNSVRLFFNGRGRLTGLLKSWNEKTTSLTIPGLGDIMISSAALGRIQFPK